MVDKHLAKLAVQHELTHIQAMNEALAVYLEWVEPQMLPPKRSRATKAQRLEAVRQAMAEHPITADAMRATGLPKATFFRYRKQLTMEMK